MCGPDLCSNSPQVGAHFMKFRLVWMGPEDDPDASPAARKPISQASSSRPSFQQRGTEMVRHEMLADGHVKVTALANFTARVVRDFLLDDDAGGRRDFELEAELDGRRIRFVLRAAEFGRMAWRLPRLGPRAIIYPGKQQHAREAIQSLSGLVPQEHIFTHLGWTKDASDWVYLHAGGAIGREGSRSEVQVRLPAALRGYHVQLPNAPDKLVGAVRASLRLLSLAPDRITFPLLAAVYRAVLGNVDFSIFLTGPRGSFKTALAALCQQHFGADMDASALPANFASTANALEGLAFSAKDALLVVDDFVPVGGIGDRALHGVAERLFRSAGNRQGRSRMSGSGRLCEAQAPRALVLATGEEVPRGESLRARLLIVELAPEEVDRAALSKSQVEARQGQLASALGAFLSWTSRRYEEVQQQLHTGVRQLRNQGQLAAKTHARLPSALAQLQGAWDVWLQFALEVGAINPSQQLGLQQRGARALGELAALQDRYQEASDPALRFLALLRAALANGRAHVADRQGAPESAELWGWRRKPTGRRWTPTGIQIGWVAGHELFLDPAASYHIAQQLAGTQALPISEQTLRHRLHQRRLLATVDAGRQMLLVRRTLEGRPRQVLHLKASDLISN